MPIETIDLLLHLLTILVDRSCYLNEFGEGHCKGNRYHISANFYFQLSPLAWSSQQYPWKVYIYTLLYVHPYTLASLLPAPSSSLTYPPENCV